MPLRKSASRTWEGMYRLRSGLAALARFVPAPLKRFCRSRGWRPGLYLTRALDRWWEPDVQRFMRATIRKGDTCVDVGASLGNHTGRMARLVGPTGTVVAFEPHHELVSELRSYVAGARWGRRVRVEQAAVGDGAASQVSFYLGGSEGGTMSLSVIPPEAPIRASTPELVIDVPSMALDQVFEPGERVDFIKIDAEGAGAAILAGSRRILSALHPAICMEVHNASECEAMAALTQLGYCVQTTTSAPLAPPEAPGATLHVTATRPATG